MDSVLTVIMKFWLKYLENLKCELFVDKKHWCINAKYNISLKYNIYVAMLLIFQVKEIFKISTYVKWYHMLVKNHWISAFLKNEFISFVKYLENLECKLSHQEWWVMIHKTKKFQNLNCAFYAETCQDCC